MRLIIIPQACMLERKLDRIAGECKVRMQWRRNFLALVNERIRFVGYLKRGYIDGTIENGKGKKKVVTSSRNKQLNTRRQSAKSNKVQEKRLLMTDDLVQMG